VSVLEIHRYPDSILAKVCAPVATIDGRVAGMLHNLVDTMYAANGIGLAAPQVGVLENAIVVDVDPDNRGKQLLKLINPEIVESSGTITTEEGCLSVVNFTAEITRSRHILVHAWSVDQNEIELELDDLAAVCVQHEIDHLRGTLLTDHISRLKREMYRKRLKKMAQANMPPGSDPSSSDDSTPRI